MPSHVRLTPQRKIVLCVDDNEDMLECEKAFLESFGYSVLTAPSGGEALHLASLHSVDVVIVDYLMPEIGQRYPGRSPEQCKVHFGGTRPDQRWLHLWWQA